jgi:hypothetical protein
MQNITIGRFEADDTAQGAVTPGDKSWQLVIDKDGYPHLYVRTPLTLNGEKTSGMVLLDEFLPEGVTVRSLMQNEYGEPIPEDQLDEAYAECMERRGELGVSCPRL